MRRLLLAGLVAFVAPAWAGDGALEINQACVATGCFPGDTPGFPINTQPSQKYLLTSNLTFSGTHSAAIFLAADASLDMNDFAITGATTCSGNPPVCSGGGDSDGVSLGKGSALRNGTIRGFGRWGVILYEANLIDGVQITNVGQDAIYGSARGAIIRGCRIHDNGHNGIYEVSDAGAVGSVVTENTIFRNGATGIEAAGGALIVGNSIHRNASFGVYGYGNAGYGGNTLDHNNADGAQVNNAKQIGTNVCGSDTTCP